MIRSDSNSSRANLETIKDLSSHILEDIGFLTTTKLRAAYIGCLYANLGDLVLLDVFKNLFSNKYFLYSKEYRGKLLHLLGKEHTPFDLSFLGGGTLINVSSGFLQLLKKCPTRKRVVFGTGVIDPEFWSTVENSYSDVPAWTDYLNSCEYIGVRGPRSATILKEWGVQKEIRITGDPVLYFADKKINKKKCNKILGVNLGVANGNLWGKCEKKVASAITPYLREMLSAGWQLKFFPVWENDCPYILDIIRALGLSSQKVMLRNFLNLNEFMQELRAVDVFIGMKLHSVILAACTYTPHIMIEYRPKCSDFMESINMGHLNVRCDRLCVDELIHLTETLYGNITPIQERLFTEVNNLKNTLIYESTQIAKIIN